MADRRTRRPAALACALALIAAAAPAAPPRADAASAAARKLLPEFVEFLKLPNVTSASTADIRANADWLEAAFKRHGLAARQLADGDTPMVFAETRADPKKRTVLFYAHMDGQPVKPADWAQPSPFIPVLKACATLEKCDTLPFDRLSGPVIDSEWRLFARSAADDKAPIIMMIAALDALRESGRTPAVNVKLLIDSHEEGGPPTLQDVVTRNADLLRADGVVMLDGPMHASNRPTIVFGHRGGGVMRLTVFGPRVAAHSGHFGNYAPNPAQNLARLIASFKDADGRVTIPGFYDGATADFAGNAGLTPVVDDEEALRARLGIATAEKVGRDYRAAIARPSLNLIGLGAGSLGALDQSIIPDRATAAFDLRTVPGIAFDRQIALVRGAVERQGYHLVTDVPTDDERARYPLIASLFARSLSDALFTVPDSTVGKWAVAGLSRPGAAAVTIPMMGGSVPSGPLVSGLKAPTIIIPLVNADDNQHAPNENLRLGNYLDGVRSLAGLLAAPL
jgi:acetylornithine deacetylase/succinyl-diaminopimelate desuccinylase-like protein